MQQPDVSAVAPAAAGPATGGRLLEREAEIASVDALIADAAGGQARLAFVEGPAGIGKTRLLAEARARAARAGFSPLVARGGELEREFPYGVVRQLYESRLVDGEARERAFAGAAASARTIFGPVAESDDRARAGDPSFATLHGLYWLTVDLSADGPLLVVVDDLHWCDRPSLRFLAHLVRRLEGLPVLVACSLRAEPGVDAALLGEIAGDPLSVSLRPRPLSEAAVAELVRERLGGDDHAAFSAACHAATGGNPLLLNELLKALDAERVTPDAAHVGMVADLGSHDGLRASRARIVQAADGERRRIARDLHDGLQARLVLLAIKANGLREGAAASAGLRADAAELEEGLRAAITELRELVHGVMPAALTERGLYAAAEELTDRVPIPTELDVRHNGTALPGPVESTGYFVVCEALANAVKHSRASELAVRLEHAGQRLRIEVSDDGVGGARANGGAGLRGMTDRVEALDGRLVVHSPPGGGTRLVAEVPCGS